MPPEFVERRHDSTGDTLRHARRVGELLLVPAADLAQRMVSHDASKIEPPEKETFDEYTPKLKDMIYGSGEYKACLTAMGPALQHHYAHNRHHPEYHEEGIAGMTLVDLLEMLADWKASGERSADGGSLRRSLKIQCDRFKISDQLYSILLATAQDMEWLDPEPPVTAN